MRATLGFLCIDQELVTICVLLIFSIKIYGRTYIAQIINVKTYFLYLYIFPVDLDNVVLQSQLAKCIVCESKRLLCPSCRAIVRNLKSAALLVLFREPNFSIGACDRRNLQWRGRR